MKTLFVFFTIFMMLQGDVLKSADEFELKLDFQFKDKPVNENSLEIAKTIQRTQLPFLTAELLVKKVLPDEARIRVVDNVGNTLATKNLTKGSSLKFDLGYTDDLKDQISTHKFQIHFYSRERIVKRSIVILFEKDGTFFVNGEKRGRI